MRAPLLRTTIAAALALAAPAAIAGLAPPASMQECNTRCQVAQTECQIRCDGDAACARKCHDQARACVGRCTADGGGD
jgi:hypothetical protein